MWRSCFLVALLVATHVHPLAALDLPTGAELMSETQKQDIYAAPVAPFDGQAVPSEAHDGTVTRQIWQFPLSSHGANTVLKTVIDGYTADGYAVVFQCAGAACGGYDFRFGTEIARPPELIVNLQDFHFATLEGPDNRTITALASRSYNTSYLQLISVTPDGVALDPQTVQQVATKPSPRSDLTMPGDIQSQGFAVLEDLVFETGSTTLGQERFQSLSELAEILKADNALAVLLVGHSDSVGSLAGNIALSRQRAEAVRKRLINVYDIAAKRIQSEGIGFLAPRDTNETDAGKTRNRRVVAVLVRD